MSNQLSPSVMSYKNLDELLRANGGPVNHLRNSPSGPNPYPVVQSEYTNWRDEQRAWQQTAVLFNQSYHMTDMYVSGPDAFKLLEKAGYQQLQGLRGQQGEAVRSGELGRLRHRRRRAVLPRQGLVQPHRAAGRCTTGCSITPRPAATT
jgi:hypothetical protein